MIVQRPEKWLHAGHALFPSLHAPASPGTGFFPFGNSSSFVLKCLLPNLILEATSDLPYLNLDSNLLGVKKDPESLQNWVCYLKKAA